MNPLDPLELHAFVRHLNEEMPVHTETTAKIKRSYSQGMPKNLMEYSSLVDNKFLNDNLAIIEEMHHRDQIHYIPKWFRDYQIKHFAKFGILNKDSFFATRMRDGFRKHFASDLTEIRAIGHHASMSFHNPGFTSVIGNTKVFGSTIEAGGSVSTSDATSVIRCTKGNTLGNIDDFYDRLAIDCVVGGNNTKLGLYDDLSSAPNARLGQVGSHSQISGFNWQSMTEVALTTVQIWIAHCHDGGTCTFHLNTQTNKNDSTAFASAMPATYSIAGSNTDGFYLKAGHS